MSWPWPLPPGWEWAPFGMVASVASQLVKPEHFPELPHVAPNHIESGSGRLLEIDSVANDGVTSPNHHFYPNQILYSKIRPYLAKVVHVDFEGLCSADMYPIETDLEPRFLKWWMLTREFTRRAAGEQARTILPKINRRALARLPVPVAPAGEQRRIVEILEDHLSRLDAAQQLLAGTRRRSGALLNSALQAGLHGRLVQDDLSEGSARELAAACGPFAASEGERVWPIPSTWAWVRLGELFQVNVGATPTRSNSRLWAGDLPWVSSGEVAFNRISDTREHIEREAAGNPLTRIHPPGTVLLAMIGEGKTRGQAAILDVEAAHNQNCASIRVSDTRVPPEYIFGFLQERYVETRRAGSGGQQQALNKAAIERFPVPIPPLGTQRRLVDAWAAAREATRRLGEDATRAAARTDALRRAVLAAAFEGKLTGRHTDAEIIEEKADGER